MNQKLITESLIFENLESAIILVDSDSFVQLVNLSAETLFQKSRRLLVGQSIDQLISSEEVNQRLAECLQSNTKYTLREVEIVAADNQPTLVDITLSGVFSEVGDSFVLIEVNSINRISRFMKDSNQKERQQAFRLMMRSMAHEIKNPLGGIRGAAQLLSREDFSDTQSLDTRQEMIDILIKEADRLTRLVDRIMGPKSQLQRADFNIHEVLEHVLQLITANQNKEINIVRNYDPALPEIHIDQEQIIQAILNIIVNAVEAQNEMEQVTIGIKTEFDRVVTINQKMHRQVLKIRIWDEGPGVDEGIKEILFDPLITNRAEGTGLGLSITQEIIGRHDGVVQLEQYQGKTCFTIYLPYNAEQETHTAIGVEKDAEMKKVQEYH